MKKLLYALVVASAIAFTYTPAQAQAWERNSKVLSLGFGASHLFHLDGYYYGGPGPGPGPRIRRGWYMPVTGHINFQGEFGIHKYVGLGFTTGFGGGGNRFAGEVNMPIGMIANFHFYQLIQDKKGKDIHADKLDIYAGASIGSGIAIRFYNNDPDYFNTTRFVPLAFGGLHAGIRYYFKPKVGVNAEVGFGKSLINVGFSFKI